MSAASEIVAPLLVAVVAGVPSFLAWRSAQKTKTEMREQRAREDARTTLDQVYGAAYDRAQRINQEIVSGLREEIIRLKADLGEMRSQVSHSEHRNVELERQIAALERSVDRMSALLQQHGIELPPNSQRRPA